MPVLTAQGSIRLFILLLLSVPTMVFAHGVASSDAAYLQSVDGIAFLPFVYLGAKHMVTGYDHLLFLAGVVFFLYRLRDVGIYVTLFALGHSITLLTGVLTKISLNAYLIDCIIGLSVAYKALDNLGAFQRWFGFTPNQKGAVLFFGLFHGFGLATKLQDFQLPEEGLLVNLVAFNVGVEIGQLLALVWIVLLMDIWRKRPVFVRQAYAANTVLLCAGFLLAMYQLTGYLTAV
ncbi:HupE/UreJ family protein [Neptuniibacter sp. CAU 1671]|uniref:HupE/UreJ family protein n=1 Tax=Neptuniibacter sp. CAU 1671 TaxID=3032593 RepID=UPI0023DC6C62|nr:HupE/UreJ family protein [Neptuniibacter sp. CAU 1671]MDF2180615.1 HupE/UreJ family protein [Neptuniibacter sp. CAU 1671]